MSRSDRFNPLPRSFTQLAAAKGRFNNPDRLNVER
jgi:hypothetical protein